MYYKFICKKCKEVTEKVMTLSEYEKNFNDGKQLEGSKIECDNCKEVGILETKLNAIHFDRFWESCR